MTSAILKSTRIRVPSLGDSMRVITGLWHAYRDWRETRAAISDLRSLDDRMLKDMGIRRSEIESVILGGDRDTSRRPRT